MSSLEQCTCRCCSCKLPRAAQLPFFLCVVPKSCRRTVKRSVLCSSCPYHWSMKLKLSRNLHFQSLLKYFSRAVCAQMLLCTVRGVEKSLLHAKKPSIKGQSRRLSGGSHSACLSMSVHERESLDFSNYCLGPVGEAPTLLIQVKCS